MEKEPQGPESMSTVTIKPEYAPSEYSSEPPPAYDKPRSASVQVARIVAVTVIVTSIVLGGFILASAYVSANAACRQFEQELELLSEAADRLQPEALVQDEPSAHSKRSSPNSIDEDPKDHDDSEDSSDESPSSSSSSSEEEDPNSNRSQFDLEQLASHLLEKNQKTKMNCVVEKKRAEEVVDHKPKTIRLPFGVNLTTDPRLEVRSGERMVIVCESGTVKSSQQPQPPKTQDDDDDSSSSSSSSSSSDQDVDDGDTIMIQPVMIPIPRTRYETHMNQRMPPPPPAPQFMQIQIQPQQLQLQPDRIVQIQQAQQQQQPQQQQQQQQQPDFPPNPILRHIVQQIIAQKIMEAQRAREEQMMVQQQQPQQQLLQEEIPRLPHRFQVPPPQAQQQQQQQQQPQYAQRFPIPEEVLTQLNRLPNRDVIVAVSSESDSSEDGPSDPRTSSEEQPQQPQRMIPQEIRLMPHNIRVLAQEPSQELPQEVRFVQEQRQGAAEMNGRQTYGMAVPVQMMAQQEELQPQPQQQAQQVQLQVQQVADESRPHVVQPRSVPLMEV